MVLEVARIRIAHGAEAAFEAAVAEAAPLFRRARGCRSMALRRSVEAPDCYVLIVDWATLEDHTEGFRNSRDFEAWRALVSPHFAAPPEVEHLDAVAEHF